MGVSSQIINLQTELNYLLLGQDLFDFLWFDMAPPINPNTHPPSHQSIHPPIGGEFSTDFKSSNRIKISWLIQVLLNFYWFGGPPWVGVGGGLNGGLEMMWGWQGQCGDNRNDMGMMGTTWGWQGQCGDNRNDMGMTGMTWGSQGRLGRHHYHDKHFGGHLQFLYMYVCACMHACACMCTCVGAPPPLHPHPPSTTPQSHREPKTPKFNESWIRFCLKILCLWTLPNSYRL